MSTVSPGSIHGLRAGKDYTLGATLKGYDTAYVATPAVGFPWPVPINFIIQVTGGYDSTVDITLRPCSGSAGCSEGARPQ